MANSSKNRGSRTSRGPAIIFSEKNPERSNYCTPGHKHTVVFELTFLNDRHDNSKVSLFSWNSIQPKKIKMKGAENH